MESFRQSQNCSCFAAVDESSVPECPNSTSNKEQLTSIPPTQQQSKMSTSKQSRSLQFPRPVASFAVGMTRVDRDEFAGKFDMGVPLGKSTPNNKQVLILHGRQDAMPMPTVQNESSNDDGTPLLSVDDATANCDYLNVVLTDDSSSRRQCLAIMGQFESYHVQRFMRIGRKGPLDPELPLRYVQRGLQNNGASWLMPPNDKHFSSYWPIVATYLSNIDTSLAKLKPIAQRVAANNTVIAMVCNFGQSEILMNFVCSARARGLEDLPVVVFATDQETHDLAESLGLTSYYDNVIFSGIPKEHAEQFGDATFGRMVSAKIFCVHMLSVLKFDVLFSDVDVLFYRNPLDYFHGPAAAEFDVLFQDDGSRGKYYAPYAANAGFYYVRYSQKTRYFLNSYVMGGDLALMATNDQIELAALLAEHASMTGLRVKTLSRDDVEFPGGHNFHERNSHMKEIITGKRKPFIFHMSWTKNKDDKIRFFQQMGDWFVETNCVQTTTDNLLGGAAKTKGALVSTCCLAEAIIKCHYSDKPSKIPCRDSPFMDTFKNVSFW
jgi:hypothetical protein